MESQLPQSLSTTRLPYPRRLQRVTTASSASVRRSALLLAMPSITQGLISDVRGYCLSSDTSRELQLPQRLGIARLTSILGHLQRVTTVPAPTYRQANDYLGRLQKGHKLPQRLSKVTIRSAPCRAALHTRGPKKRRNILSSLGRLQRVTTAPRNSALLRPAPIRSGLLRSLPFPSITRGLKSGASYRPSSTPPEGHSCPSCPPLPGLPTAGLGRCRTPPRHRPCPSSTRRRWWRPPRSRPKQQPTS